MECPWNERFAEPNGDPVFTRSEPAVLSNEVKLSTSEFNKKFKTSPVKRAKRRGYLRNVGVALGNTIQNASIQALSNALGDKEALVRGHAAWALGQLKENSAKQELEKAIGKENDPWVLKEIQNALNP
jgi:epoxyqueuosine reductase